MLAATSGLIPVIPRDGSRRMGTARSVLLLVTLTCLTGGETAPETGPTASHHQPRGSPLSFPLSLLQGHSQPPCPTQQPPPCTHVSSGFRVLDAESSFLQGLLTEGLCTLPLVPTVGWAPLVRPLVY